MSECCGRRLMSLPLSAGRISVACAGHLSSAADVSAGDTAFGWDFLSRFETTAGRCNIGIDHWRRRSGREHSLYLLLESVVKASLALFLGLCRYLFCESDMPVKESARTFELFGLRDSSSDSLSNSLREPSS